MRGVVFAGSGISVRDDLPEPEPRPGEVLLTVRLAGICDTDLQLARGYMGFSGIPGHEFVGVAPDGQRVTAEINAPCRTCDACKAGLGNHCPRRTVLGILNRPGCMAERVCVPEHCLHAIPDSLSDEEAVFIEPLAAAFRILEQVSIDQTARVAVLGDGKLGLLSAWVLSGCSARVTWVGKHAEKLALAGPGIETVLVSDLDPVARPFDVVVDCTGSVTGLPLALRVVRPCGTVVLKTTVAAAHAANLAPIVIDEIRVVGSRCGPFPAAIEALRAGRFPVRTLIEAEYRLSEAVAAFQHAGQRGARKILIRISDI